MVLTTHNIIYLLPIFRSAIPVVYLRTKCTKSYRYGSQKHNYIYVIYKMLVYVKTSHPTTCFGLFQLGHLQVGRKGHRNYTIMHCSYVVSSSVPRIHGWILVWHYQSLGVPFPLCILELSRQYHIDMAGKNTTIFYLLSSKIHNGDGTPKD
jgi:hypothetical protein